MRRHEEGFLGRINLRRQSKLAAELRRELKHPGTAASREAIKILWLPPILRPEASW